MEHLNYCRQIAKTAQQQMDVPSLDPLRKALWSHLLDLCANSTKFLLPDNGLVLDDADLRALDEEVELRLPYRLIALEWQHTAKAEEGLTQSSKRVLFAREHDDRIVCDVALWVDAMGVWTPFWRFKLPRVGYIRRDGPKPMIAIEALNGEVASDVHTEAFRLLAMLNALQCTNVTIDRSDPKHAGRKVKSALPFDCYHVLAIRQKTGDAAGPGGGTHRSPREHLRRGHIRRLSDGRKTWVNATVVAAGRGSGVVTKDYAVHAAA